MSINLKGKLKRDEANWAEIHPTKRSQPKALDAAVESGTSSEEGGLDLGRILEAVQRRIWLVIAINIAMMGAAIVWSRTRPPAYEGSFKILVEPVTAEQQVASSLKGNQSGFEEQDLGSAQSSKNTLDYPTQIQLLLSENLLKSVIEKLKPAHPQTSYETVKNSLTISRLKEAEETKILEVKYRAGSASETQEVLNLVSHAYIQYSLSKRQTNLSRAIQFVDSQLPKFQAQAQDLELTLQNFRQQHQLIDPSILGSQLGAQTTSTKQEQLTTQIELAKTKQLYSTLKQQLQMQPKDAEAASVLSEAPGYQQLLKQLQELDVEIQIQSTRFTNNHPSIAMLREKRQKLLPLLQANADTALGSRLSRNTKNIQSLPYQNALRQDLSKQFIAAVTQVQVLEAKLNQLNVASQALAVQTSQLPTIARQYENLQRRLKVATAQVSNFSQKREELMISAARQEVPWELIASPSVKEVSSASLSRDLILGSILGLLLGTGVALLLESMNNVIYSVEELQKELNIYILGMIPKRQGERKYLKSTAKSVTEMPVLPLSEGSNNITNNYYQFSPFIESFRALNTQIRLLNRDLPVKSLVVSSSLPSEGKTTVSLQLAQAAAAMGQRVLMVNADLRKPSLKQLSALHGLTDVIEGRSQLMDTIQPFPEIENLYVLPSGSIALDPTSILSSKRMQDLMENCRDSFDFIIYDTPPLGFTDSLLLIPQTDGLLLVAGLGKVDREVFQNSIETLAVSEVSVLGLVANMTKNPYSTYYTQSSKSISVTALNNS
jgi:polysaccharide biosynthesis transport protein